jgi:hypothetical protein
VTSSSSSNATFPDAVTAAQDAEFTLELLTVLQDDEQPARSEKPSR